jgi:beta-glucosidase
MGRRRLEVGLALAVVVACGSRARHADGDDDEGVAGGMELGGAGGAAAASGGRAGAVSGGGGSTAGGGRSDTGAAGNHAGGAGTQAGQGGAGDGGEPAAGEGPVSAGEGGAPMAGAGNAGELLGVLDLRDLDARALAYPAPPGVEAARTRAEAIVAELTVAQKVTLLQGAGGGIIGGTLAAGPVPSLSFDDGPGGVAHVGGATAFPDPITLAASWDRDLVERWAEAMGAEERAKGVAVQLGPMMNFARVPQAGRNFETFGEDPYLSAELAFVDVRGIQSNGIVATAKHFVGNEQETNRETENSEIDERALHEIYYLPFEASVSAGVGSVMCSYNRVNGVYACENPVTLGDLKGELGFSGWVMTDWTAAHSSGAAAAGLDQEMPNALYFTVAALTGHPRLDDMATRVVTSLARVGVLDDPPPVGSAYVDVTSPAHTALALEAATAGITLLKNDGPALPFGDDVESIVVVGAAGHDAPYSTGGGSAHVVGAYVSSPFAAITARAPAGTTVTYVRGDPGDEAEAVAAAADADAVVVVAAVASGEFSDRTSLALGSTTDALISAVAAANPRTVVVLDVPAPVMMPWVDVVGGLLAAWYPGQENGNALASVLFGDVNPSGKLPVSFPAVATDLPVPGTGSSVVYSEGLALGYRWLDSQNIDPLFEFGFGLSYTTFSYGALELRYGETHGSVDVSFELTNTGERAGSEVAQLYLGFPGAAGEPPRVLRGFERVTLEPGAARRVHVELPARAFSCWSSTAHARYAPSGTYTLSVGSSSRALPLTASFEVMGTEPQP